MTKQNLFSLVSFFLAVGWLEIFEVKTSLAFAIYILAIVTALNLLYGFCKEDKEDE